MIDLFRSDNVLVRSVPAEDVSRWVVTFDNYGIGHGFDRLGFGEEFLRQAGVSAIHVLGRQEDWYQYPEMAEAMAAVRQATAGAGRVMTYGSSMGGYAALRFADAAGANAVLAISPQYSIDPQKAPFETRWLQDGQRIEWLPQIDGALTCRALPNVVFDPSSDDRRHVDLIEAEINIRRVALPYCGHPAATFLSDVGLLGEVVFGALSGGLVADDFRREARRRRRGSSIYHAALAALQPSVRPEWGVALARRALDIAPKNPLSMNVLASHLTQLGRHEEAIALHESAVDASSRDANYLVSLANALVASGRPTEAVEIAREVVGRLPNSAHVRSWLGFVYWNAGERPQAITAMERALILHPGYEAYQATLQHYRDVETREPLRQQRGIGRLLKVLRRKPGRSAPIIPAMPGFR